MKYESVESRRTAITAAVCMCELEVRPSRIESHIINFYWPNHIIRSLHYKLQVVKTSLSSFKPIDRLKYIINQLIEFNKIRPIV